MKTRTFWHQLIDKAWKSRSIIWLSGVRRAGKTTICRSLPGVSYFDCELPRVRQLLEDPEEFLNQNEGTRIVLDEIHRLSNPSELLKIAADHYPKTKIIATGSSTLGASSKFKDTLAGRKRDIWLTPMIAEDLAHLSLESDFSDRHHHPLDHRLLAGGLPPFFLSKEGREADFQEWMDAYWAKDIQELFRLEKRHAFQKFMELLFIQSGGIFEATSFARPCEVSRTTIQNYLGVLEATYVVNILRPFSTHPSRELTTAPKVYVFDTGFISYYRGWDKLRNEDKGALWEHLVLNEMNGRLQSRKVLYWRDKRGHEVDFIWMGRKPGNPVAVECKLSSKQFDAKNLAIFRGLYPKGKNLLVAADIQKPYLKKIDGLQVIYTNLENFCSELEN